MNKFSEIITIDGQEINKKYLISLDKSSREQLIEPIFNIFRQQGWQFPEFTTDVLRKEYKRIIDYKLNIDNKLNNNSSIGTKLCKYFCAESYYNSSEFGRENVIKSFENDDLLKKVIKNRLGLYWYEKNKNDVYNISHRSILQGFRSSRIGSIVGMFKPEIAKFINLKYSLEGDLIVDYSAGFGGRLLGAMSCNRKYIGIDPLTAPELEKMIKFFDFKDCKLIHGGSENYCNISNCADLIWSSPPFFQTEIYSHDESQAYMRGENYFYNTYWIKTLKNAKTMLKPNKWFGLHISGQDKMLQMAKDVFGNVVEKIELVMNRAPTTFSNNGSKRKSEFIYMFINSK